MTWGFSYSVFHILLVTYGSSSFLEFHVYQFFTQQVFVFLFLRDGMEH